MPQRKALLGRATLVCTGVLASLRCDVSSAAVPEHETLFAAEGVFEDKFGAGLAIDGDSIVIGATGADDFGSFSGAVYFFRRDGVGQWMQEARLTEPIGAAVLNSFGDGVAIVGDIALVGATHVFGFGAVYVFQREPMNGWAHKSTLLRSDPSVGDGFGHPIVFDGEIAIVGARGDDENGDGSGAAYVFRMIAPNSWLQEQKLTPSDAVEGQQFGAGLAQSGDRLLVGAPTSTGDPGLGAAYVFHRDVKGVWVEESRLSTESLQVDDFFGESVGLCGDIAIVGAPLHDLPGMSSSGSAFAFRYNGDSWSFDGALAAPDASMNDLFGQDVSVLGSYALIGARLADAPYGMQVGAVYLFRRTALGWQESETFVDSDPSAGETLGSRIALDAKLAIISATSKRDSEGIATGAALLYDLSTVLCPLDINADGVIDTADLGLLISRFGDTGCDCAAEDVNADGSIDTADLGLVIAGFGQPCP